MSMTYLFLLTNIFIFSYLHSLSKLSRKKCSTKRKTKQVNRERFILPENKNRIQKKSYRICKKGGEKTKVFKKS